jgi:hypothetical protein
MPFCQAGLPIATIFDTVSSSAVGIYITPKLTSLRTRLSHMPSGAVPSYRF